MLLSHTVVLAINANNDGVLDNLKGLSINGQTKQKDIPLFCRVRLFEKHSGRLIMDKSTNNDGHYEFDHLTKAMFFIVAHHPASQYNAVIQDNVVPK